MNDFSILTGSDILKLIEELQAIQKKNPLSSENWRRASAALQPLFAEMAKRQAKRQEQS